MMKSKFCFILCIFLIGFSCRKQGDFKKQNITSPVVIAQLTDQMKSNLDDIIQQYNQWVTQINQGLPNLTGLLGTNTALIGQINTIIALNLPPTGVFNVNDLLTESKNILNQLSVIQKEVDNLATILDVNPADITALNADIQSLQTNINILVKILNNFNNNITVADQLTASVGVLNSQYNIWVTQIKQNIGDILNLVGLNTDLGTQISTIIALNLQVKPLTTTQLLAESQSMLSQIAITQNKISSLFLTGNLNLTDQQILNQNIQLLQTNIATLTNILNDFATNVSIENVQFSNLTNQIITGSVLNTNGAPVEINTSITLKNAQNISGTYKPIVVKLLWGTDTIATQTYNNLTSSTLAFNFSKLIPKNMYSNIKSEKIEIIVWGNNGQSNVYKTNITINAFSLYTLQDLYAIDNLFLPTEQIGKTFVLENNIEIGNIGTSKNAIINNFEGTLDGNFKRLSNIIVENNNNYLGFINSSISGFAVIKNVQLEYTTLHTSQTITGSSALVNIFKGGSLYNINILIQNLQILGTGFGAIIYDTKNTAVDLSSIAVHAVVTENVNPFFATLGVMQYTGITNTPTPGQAVNIVLIGMGTKNICFGTFSIVNSTFPNFYYYSGVSPICGYPVAANYELKPTDINKPSSFSLINNFLANWTFNANGWPQVRGFN